MSAPLLARAATCAVLLASLLTGCGKDSPAEPTNRAGVPARLVEAAGGGQTAPAGAPVPVAPAVRVTDAFGTPVSGVAVSFALGSGGGTVAGASATSDAAGIAAVGSWTLGPSAGVNSLTATSRAVSGALVTFSATATPNATITGQLSVQAAGESLALWRAMTLSLSRRIGASGAVSVKRAALLSAIARQDLEVARREARPELVPGSLIVTFRAAAVGAPSARSGARVSARTAGYVAGRMRERVADAERDGNLSVSGTSPAILAARVHVAPERLEEIRARLASDPAVASVEQERLVYATRLPAPPVAAPPQALARTGIFPDDPLYRPQAWHYGMLDLPRAWALTTGSSSVLVAVVDDGIRFDHPAIAANLTADGYDFASQFDWDICGVTRDNAGDGDGYDPDPTIPAEYDCRSGGLSTLGGHGLHVAGTIGAAGNDGLGLTGINWRVRIRPVRVLGVGGVGSSYDVAQGILYAAGLPADNGAGGHVQAPSAARIINLSLGSPGPSAAERDAVEAAAAAGVLIVASAGNAANADPHYPAGFPQVLSVSAVGPDGQLASYSSYGPTVGIAAPGGDFAKGGGSFMVASTVWDFAAGRPAYAYAQGTSMAAPHVAGVAALLLAREPTLTGEQLRDRLTRFAVDAGAPGRDDQYGAGIVNARNSLTSSLAPLRELYASLYDAVTGRLVKTVKAEEGGTYRITAVEDGSFFVFAGEDEERDGAIGVPGRRLGAFGGSTMQPVAIAIAGARNYPAPVEIRMPLEVEPNEDVASAGRLVIGSYVRGQLPSLTDVDMFAIDLPAGRYTFETSGWEGACGFALEADTVLDLLQADGTTVASNDDIDEARLDYCSRITMTLVAGRYVLRVNGYTPGRYRLEVRAVF